MLLQAVVLDQVLEADLVSDIQKYLENLINNGLRHRLISLIKVWNIDRNFFHIAFGIGSFSFEHNCGRFDYRNLIEKNQLGWVGLILSTMF